MKNKFCYIFAAIALLGTAFLVSCANSSYDDAWGDEPSPRASRSTRAQKRAKLDRALSRLVLVEMSDSGEIRFGGEIMSASRFSAAIKVQGRTTPGKPVLLWYNPGATGKNTKTIGFIVRECYGAGLGKIYTEIPDDI